jgi:DNA end-binding protein Ku
MARAIWKGAISFGLVTIPVRLGTALQDKDVSFHLLHKSCGTRLKQLRWCPEHEEPVEWADVVRGFEWAPGEYVIMDDEDFEKVSVESTRTIEISEFVPLDQIDPIYFERSYFLEPEDVGKKPFVLLRQALEDDKRVGIARLTMRQREYLCAIRLYENTLLLNTLHYADEIRAAEDAPTMKDVKVTDKEVAMAKTLIDVLSGDFEPDKYEDRYRSGLLEIIEDKREGKEVVAPKAKPTKPVAEDLMAALRASVEAVRKGGKAADEEAEEEEEAAPKRKRKAS